MFSDSNLIVAFDSFFTPKVVETDTDFNVVNASEITLLPA